MAAASTSSLVDDDVLRLEGGISADQKDVSAPLLSCYDPYHETTYFVQYVGKAPTAENNAVLKAFYQYPFSAKLNYQDFSPHIQCSEFNVWQSPQTFK